jgi:hypothetical protein
MSRHRLIEAATARPWRTERDLIIGPQNEMICACGDTMECSPEDLKRDDANAELIVTAVNAHEKLIVARNMLDDLIPLMDSWMGYLPPEGEQAFKEWRADAWQVAQLAKGRHSEDFDGDYTTLASLKVKP